MRRKTIVAVVIAAACGLMVLFALLRLVGREQSGAPWPWKGANVILISIDTLRADHLGCYGWEHPTSPFVDRFARDAVLFETSLAQAPSTEPSHASIFTSLIPSHHGAFFSRKVPLPEEMVTMAELFKAGGYRTAGFSDSGQVDRLWGFSQGFDEYNTVFKRGIRARFRKTVEQANDWLEQHQDEQFFLFLHTYEPHHPYLAEQRHLDAIGHRYDGELPDYIDKDLLNKINHGQLEIDDDDRRHIIATYGAEIHSVDEAFGNLVSQLQKLGLYDDTLIVFTSDHGEEFGEHGWMGWHSHTLYDELLRVPLIVKLPGKVLAGKRVRGISRGIDILPTLLEAADLPPARGIDGQSLLGFALDGESSIEESVAQRDAVENELPESLHLGKWKYYNRRRENGQQLFDLERDPGEQDDLAAAYPEEQDRLEARLDELKAARLDWAARPAAERPDKVDVDAEQRARLEALGYLVKDDSLSVKEALSGLACPDCNVLLLTIDTVRADHLPCYGNERDTTPNICAYAEKSILFENAYSPAPVTLPAFTAIMSGSLIANEPMEHVLAHYEKQSFLGEEMTARGFTTAALTDHYALNMTDNEQTAPGNLMRGFQEVTNISKGRYSVTAPQLTNEVSRWLGQHRDDRFFLWVHYLDPHLNYAPPSEVERRFGYDPERCGRVVNNLDVDEIRRIEDSLTPTEVECLVALHQAELFHTDRYVGQLLDRLDTLGLAENTLVILFSDHGEEFKERTRIGHGATVHDELVHVPLIIYNPRSKKSGRVLGAASTFWVNDIVREASAGRTPRPRGEVVARTWLYAGNGRDRAGAKNKPNQFTLVSERRKAILNPREGLRELFDLQADPGELVNLAGSGDRGEELLVRLEEWIDQHTVPAGQPSQETQDFYRNLQKRLRALGYIDSREGAGGGRDR